jgi:hypothetical protein
MSADCVVVDANIAFKSLCTGRGKLRRRLAPDAKLKTTMRAMGFDRFFEP